MSIYAPERRASCAIYVSQQQHYHHRFGGQSGWLAAAVIRLVYTGVKQNHDSLPTPQMTFDAFACLSCPGSLSTPVPQHTICLG